MEDDLRRYRQAEADGYAEVSLVLDNTAHIFDMDESEVMVTRRYYRSERE